MRMNTETELQIARKLEEVAKILKESGYGKGLCSLAIVPDEECISFFEFDEAGEKIVDHNSYFPVTTSQRVVRENKKYQVEVEHKDFHSDLVRVYDITDGCPHFIGKAISNDFETAINAIIGRN